jgi:hypothetical protein
MFDAEEAAKKIVSASVDIQKAKGARPWPGYATKVMNAERRLTVLRSAFNKYQNDPDFQAAYEREISKLADDPGDGGRASQPTNQK